ncbi:MAG: HAD family hydrolase [Syntrophobacteraceae bacterium]
MTHPAKHFAAVLFDADGTLLDTLDDLADSMNDTLRHFGFPPHATERYKYFVGDGMENLVRRSVPDSVRNDPATISGCLKMMRAQYERNWNNKTRPYAGIPELLDGLAARGVKMAILSNKPDDFMQLMTRELLPAWRFEVVMGERPPTPRKPDPTSALAIAGTLAVRPEDFLYLGDTATDMLTANAAGMFAVGALWGFRPSGELAEAGAKKLIATPAELLELL